jgi:membrane protein implicated in regulation of membrane protease activity
VRDCDSVTELNRRYIAFILAVASLGLGFIAWSITSPALAAASRGEPLPGGWSWPTVMFVDALVVLVFAWLLWRIYKDARTHLGALGISQPSLRGRRHIAWADVKRVEVFRGVGYHVYGPRFRIVVAAYAYRDPQSVIATIHDHLGRRPTRRCT